MCLRRNKTILSYFLLLVVLSLLLSCCPNSGDPGMENVKQGVKFSSAIFGEVKYTIYIPANYNTDPSQKFPVLYLLHGGYSNHESYVCKIKLTSTIEQLMEKGTFGPTIIVMPEGDMGWWMDSKDGNKRYKSFLLDELVPYIDTTYRTLEGREHRAIGGLSMGGFGSISLAFRFVTLFKAVAATSAAIPPSIEEAENFDQFGDTFGSPFDREYYWERDPLTLAETAADIDSLAIYMDVGASDPISKRGCEKLDSLLTARGIAHQFTVYPGGHDDTYFNAHINELLEFVWGEIHP